MESTEKKPCCCCSTEEPAADTVSPADVPDAVPSCCRHKDRSPEEYKALVNRLSRIEGQVRGVRGMLEKDAYCVDVLVQVAAVNSALNSFAKELLAQHMSTCVADDRRAGRDETLNELSRLLHRIMTLTAEGRACALMGNCDNLLEDVFHPRYRGDLLRYLSRHPQTILHEMLAAQGTAFSQETTLEEIRHVVAEHYAEEREFLQSLPHIIDAGDYIFVHAGLDDVPLSLQDPERCLKRSDFYQTAPAFSKTIVLGHRPCQRLSRDGSGAPVFDAKRNLVFIDGGVGLVEGAAMNALLIADGRLRVCSVP